MRMFRGATAYEGYVWRFWFRLPYWRFIRAGCLPTVGYSK